MSKPKSLEQQILIAKRSLDLLRSNGDKLQADLAQDVMNNLLDQYKEKNNVHNV